MQNQRSNIQRHTRAFVALVFALGVSGCATHQTGPAASGALQRFFLNGVTGVVAGRYNLNGFENLPQIKTQRDFAALNKTIQQYLALVPSYIKKGDYDAALFANHIAARLTEHQMRIADSTHRAASALIANPSGSVMLNPGDMAILPAYWPADSVSQPGSPRYSQNEEDPIGKPRPVFLAGGDDAALRDAVRMAQYNTGYGNSGASSSETLNRLPVGRAVTLADGTLVERTADSFIMHNPTGKPTSIRPEALNYHPPIKELSQVRKDAGAILKNLAESQNAFVTQHIGMRMTRQDSNMMAELVQPNRVVLNEVDIDFAKQDYRNRTQRDYRYLNAMGRFAANQAEAEQAKSEYARINSPYRLAFDIDSTARFADGPRQTEFQCAAVQKKHQTHRIIGEFGEIMSVECRNSMYDRDSFYSREFFIIDKNAVQTMASRNYDNDAANKLRRADNIEDAAQNLAQLLPIVGNAESGLKCLNLDSMSLARAYARSTIKNKDQLDQQRPFVANIYNLAANPKSDTWVDKTLDCAAALPVLGTGVKWGAAGMGKLAGFGEHVAARGGDFAKAMNVFDTSIIAGKGWADAAATISGYTKANSAMATLAKATYDAAQTNKNFSDFASAMDTLGVLKRS